MSLLNMEAIKNLKDLQEQTGKDLLSALLKIYIDSTPEIVSKMQQLLLSQSYEDLSREAHSLKSSSANLGAQEMADLCKEVEYKIVGDEEFSDEDLKVLMEQIQSAYPKTLDELKRIAA